jgi:hypothetical protein
MKVNFVFHYLSRAERNKVKADFTGTEEVTMKAGVVLFFSRTHAYYKKPSRRWDHTGR